ncbi:hypothetical protein EVAR_2540_1 [Eumeta japonica]|uniref:Uncharacterized protein n=1 Tax=Eumeta variegata TaxID=151549 RepID=A0A4C1SNQ1_EUMVA|nr:hypothetical protein EVAR_2540_1 [Eumeta japonica]
MLRKKWEDTSDRDVHVWKEQKSPLISAALGPGLVGFKGNPPLVASGQIDTKISTDTIDKGYLTSTEVLPVLTGVLPEDYEVTIAGRDDDERDNLTKTESSYGRKDGMNNRMEAIYIGYFSDSVGSTQFLLSYIGLWNLSAAHGAWMLQKATVCNAFK